MKAKAGMIVSFAAVWLLASAAFGQDQQVLSSYRIVNPSPTSLEAISKSFEIANQRNGVFEVIVPKEQEGHFLSLEPKALLVTRDISAALKARLGMIREQTSSSSYRYHSLAEIQNWMQRLSNDKPELATYVRYGTSQDGRALVALRLTHAPEIAKPELMLTAATHGDELITTEVLMHLVEKLVEGFGSDSRLTQILEKHDLYFVPVVNVDGFANVQRYDHSRDPNRSYPYPNEPHRTPTASIAGIMDLFHAHHFQGSIDFHAYGELIMYPWAYTRALVEPVARERFDRLTSLMAEANRYTYGPISDVIYVAKGSSCDYYFWQTGATSVAIEIGNEKVPNTKKFPQYFASQIESTWRFIEAF